MKDRITVLFPVTDLERHGAQHQLLELVKGLDKERFRPVVLTFSPDGPMGQEFRAIPGSRLVSLKRKGKYDFLVLFKILNLIRKMKVDVVQPFLTPATFFTLLPAVLCRTPVKIVTERAGPGYSGFGHRLYLRMEDFLTRFADWAVANSRAGQEYLIKRGINPLRTKVVYNGLDPDWFTYDNESVQQVKRSLNLPPGGKAVGMLARMFPIKHHDIFLRAAAIVSRVIPDTRFALLGDGPLRSHLEDLNQELNLTSKVVFFGEQRDMTPYIMALDIVALSSEMEGLSLSICEAMTLGKPVIATDVGGNRELVEDGKTGFLVPFGDAEALAEAMIRLLQDHQTAEAMGQSAREKVITQLGLQRYVNEYQNLYEETLRQKSSKTSWLRRTWV